MEIKDIDKRIEGLEKDLERAIATVNAIEGAIQDCLYWKEYLEKKIIKEDI